MCAIQNIMIEAFNNSKRHETYKDINFYALWNRFNNYQDDDNDAFINTKGINFEDYVGCKLLTGNELFYYPELAKKLREIKEYPILKRIYVIDKEIKGMDFIEYFCKFARECFNHFEADLIEASSIVNNLINLYGNKRYTPIINCMSVSPDRCKKTLIINDTTWKTHDSRHDKFKATTHLDLYRLLGFSRNEFTRMEIEDITEGTPFIAIRIAKSWAHKGHVYWYNLDTCKPASKIEMAKWKIPI